MPIPNRMALKTMSRTIIACALLALTCIACGSRPGYEPLPPGVLEDRVWQERVIMSDQVKNRVTVDQVLETRKNSLLRLQLDIRNVTQSSQSIRTNITWFDISGFKIDTGNDGWKSHILSPKQLITVNATATDPAAVSWRVDIDFWSR
ncbi:MAG: hypothetical protein ACI8X5_000788 [Planctomycetota bacterium]|jgi:uncharacterized protein YcfL